MPVVGDVSWAGVQGERLKKVAGGGKILESRSFAVLNEHGKSPVERLGLFLFAW
jgi:hypothetical protein